jgi:hypothetical protein
MRVAGLQSSRLKRVKNHQLRTTGVVPSSAAPLETFYGSSALLVKPESNKPLHVSDFGAILSFALTAYK